MPVALYVCVILASCLNAVSVAQEPAPTLVQKYCFDCHGNGAHEGGIDLETRFRKPDSDRTLVFENVITGKMPPADAAQPTDKERDQLLSLLAKRQSRPKQSPFRRISRFELNHQINDLLGTNLDLAETIPDDRGTRRFDTDRRIEFTEQQLGAYFSVAGKLVDQALPDNGFSPEFTWRTNQLKDSHFTYNVYTRPYKEGHLFSWTRANNGNSYSFFYDHFSPPESGWYELVFDAAKVGDFDGDISIEVYAGKYYFADDRPQPQRLLDVISVGNKKVKPYIVKGFLYPGENVSIHCFHSQTWRKNNPAEGAYIKQLRVRGPVHDWPPKPFQKVFPALALNLPKRQVIDASSWQSVLEKIGGKVSVSSFQSGMEKENMLDGSNRSFWHTRFGPDLAPPPHYVVFENPRRHLLKGLNYSTWSGGNGNGQVKKYEIYESEDGKTWSGPVAAGDLEIKLAAEQPIRFSEPTRKRFIKFLVIDSFSIDGRSLASIGKLDVVTEDATSYPRLTIKIDDPSEEDLKKVIRDFAENAFAETLTDDDFKTYYDISLKKFRETGDFVAAAKLGLKGILCSYRFLLIEDKSNSESIISELARILWLSVPDQSLIRLGRSNALTNDAIRKEIDRMLNDSRSQRMVRSLVKQWLNLRSFKKISPSLKLYPKYDELLEHYLPLETEMFLWSLIVENLPISELVDSDFSFLNQRLANHYGIPSITGQQMRKVILPETSRRGGLMTMGSILKVTTDGFDTSPILRGAWISKNIAGNTLSPPPESVSAIESNPAEGKSIREQIQLHKTAESCQACHNRIDPYGFALESFDAIGKYRERYRIKLAHQGTFQYRREGYYSLGNPVDSSGKIDDLVFQDIVGLKKILLANHRKLAYNFMKVFFEYANGFEPNLQQRLALYRSIPKTRHDCRMKDLIKDVLLISFERKD